MVVRDGRVVATGSDADMREIAGAGARFVDLGGATVLPGFVDTHPHLFHFAVLEYPLVKLWDAASHDDIVSRIRERASTTPAGEWIMATPIGEPHYFIRRSWRDLAERVLPDRQVLDRAAPQSSGVAAGMGSDHAEHLRVQLRGVEGARHRRVHTRSAKQRVDRERRARRAHRAPQRSRQHVLHRRPVHGRTARPAAVAAARVCRAGDAGRHLELSQARRYHDLRRSCDGSGFDRTLSGAAAEQPAQHACADVARGRELFDAVAETAHRRGFHREPRTGAGDEIDA